MARGPAGKAPGRLSLPAALTFALAALPVSAVDVSLLVYLPPHLSGHLGVPLSVVGGAWATVRLLDIVVDPVLGVVMDSTRTRFGRYRPWMIAGVPILMAATWMLFFARPGVGGLYLIGWLLALYLGRSILHLAHPAWAATLATSYNERSRLYGLMAAAGVASMLAVLSLPVINAQMHGPDSRNIELMGWFVIALAPLMVGLAVWRTGEKVSPSAHADGPSLKDYAALLTKPDLVRLYLAHIALTLGPGWMTALYIFFSRDYKGFDASQASLLLLIYMAAGIAGAPVTAHLATRIGKDRTLLVASTAYALGLGTVLFTPYGSIWGSAPTMVWCGFMALGFELSIRSMLADVADEVRLEQGRERLSLIYALNTLSTKIAAALAIGITFPLLERLGYVAKEGAKNTPEAITALAAVFVSGPIVFVLIGGACVLGWKMTPERHAAVRAELDARDAALAAAALAAES
ncbi:MAG: major facilitator superfamily 1 [Phenylobacterium sp.]|nr:major facilitator superfamily 1 [Phenylobacterium sp.]